MGGGERARDQVAAPSGAGASAEHELEVVVFLGGTATAARLPREGGLTLGRAPESDVRVDDASVSRRHAVLRVAHGGGVTLEDVGSANGTWLRDRHATAETAPLRDLRLQPNQRVPLAVGESFNLGSVLVLLRHAGQPARAAAAAPSSSTPGGMPVVARNAAMRELLALARRVAASPISVLLLGETGVGKEVFAEVIHRASPRAQESHVQLNCGAFTEALLESELFGHEKGAFTGAAASKPGLLEAADGGTVFLDEVGELPPAVQVKLLRVIEERKVRRVGGLAPRAIDVRFVAATNRDLEAEVAAGRFRQDLYFRLNGITLTIPPLRERRDDIAELAAAFLARGATQMARPRLPSLAPDAHAALLAHHWPGNVRELRNVLERALALCEGDVIHAADLGLGPPRPRVAGVPAVAATAPVPAAEASDAAGVERDAPPEGLSERELAERRRILDALARCAGNQTDAAALLGISRRTLINRLEPLKIARPRKKA